MLISQIPEGAANDSYALAIAAITAVVVVVKEGIQLILKIRADDAPGNAELARRTERNSADIKETADIARDIKTDIAVLRALFDAGDDG